MIKVHPIALLSAVDHFERSVGNKKKRALGVLLGFEKEDTFEITNSYAVPFEESGKGVWYVDHNFHEKMFSMFRKINIKEKVLGWYVSGSSFGENDLQINELFAEYCENPILVVIDVKGRKDFELPTKGFRAERVVEKGMVRWEFKNLPCSVSAFEAEEVGVEHLVREIKDLNMNSLRSKLSSKVNSLLALNKKVEKIV